MYKTVDAEIKKALIKKGYKWNEISIINPHYTHLYEVKLDGKLVEFYDDRKSAFID